MIRAVMMAIMAAWLVGGCAEIAANERRTGMIDRASMCATCGAMKDGYFSSSSDKAMGPGEWW